MISVSDVRRVTAMAEELLREQEVLRNRQKTRQLRKSAKESANIAIRKVQNSITDAAERGEHLARYPASMLGTDAAAVLVEKHYKKLGFFVRREVITEDDGPHGIFERSYLTISW